MTQKSNISRELEQKANRFITLTLKEFGTEISEEFDRNFEREAFFNERWARRKFSDDESRGLLIRTGELRHSIREEVTGHSVIFSSDLPYAAIHNEGGTIIVTRRMKKYFWACYMEAIRKQQGGNKYFNRMTNGINGTRYMRRPPLEQTRLSVGRSMLDVAFYRAMALKKAGSKIVIPKRQFIGMHPEVERIIREIVIANTKKVFYNP